MANTTESPSYVFTFKLISGYSVVNLPNNIIVPNLKTITIKKLSYNFNQLNQYVAKMSIVGYDIHTFTDGQTTKAYTLTFFNPGGALNSQINFVNYAKTPDIVLAYGSPMSQFILVFDTDYSTVQGSLGSMSVGGSPFVTPSNPLLLEIQFQ